MAHLPFDKVRYDGNLLSGEVTPTIYIKRWDGSTETMPLLDVYLSIGEGSEAEIQYTTSLQDSIEERQGSDAVVWQLFHRARSTCRKSINIPISAIRIVSNGGPIAFSIMASPSISSKKNRLVESKKSSSEIAASSSFVWDYPLGESINIDKLLVTKRGAFSQNESLVCKYSKTPPGTLNRQLYTLSELVSNTYPENATEGTIELSGTVKGSWLEITYTAGDTPVDDLELEIVGR